MEYRESGRVSGRRRGAAANGVFALFVATTALLAGCAQGAYRMPYENGAVVRVTNDHVSHSSPIGYMYDITAQSPARAAIVAAAPGWVRFIDDSHAEPGDDNNYVWIEHPYPFCPVDDSRAVWPGQPSNYAATCVPCDRDFCNEWTTYAHMTRNSVRLDAALTEGDWVEAGEFLGYEDEVGVATGVHLHWHVAVLPPDITPTDNGYYTEYVQDSGQQPEVIPIVCHQGGQSVLWRTGIYTASGCPAEAPGAAMPFLSGQSQPRSPLAASLDRIATITDEGIAIAMRDPLLMLRTTRVMARMDADFRDLLRLGRARVSAAELKMVLELLREFERRSGGMRAVLQPIREQLENAEGRRSLGITLEDPFPGLF